MVLILASALLLAACAGIAVAPLLARTPMLYRLGVAFAAGTLLTLTLAHVLPEALAAASQAGTLFVVGFVVMMLLQQHVLEADPCCGHQLGRHAALPSFLAMSLCSFNDGILVYADAERGFASPLVWAMVLHKITSSFALVVLLREVATLSTLTRATLFTVFVLVTPLAMVLASELAAMAPVMPYLLALSGGALFYVIGSSLVPRVEHGARVGKAVLTAFLAGVLLNVAIEVFAPHAHGPGHSHPHAHTEGPVHRDADGHTAGGGEDHDHADHDQGGPEHGDHDHARRDGDGDGNGDGREASGSARDATRGGAAGDGRSQDAHLSPPPLGGAPPGGSPPREGRTTR